jgi:MFS superfamily sulfate permease-like transporter
MLEKIIKLINKLGTVAQDTSKHIVVSLYCLWVAFLATLIFGNLAGIITCILFAALFVLWELYYMKKDNKKFSKKDVVVAMAVITPFLFILIKTHLKL